MQAPCRFGGAVSLQVTRSYVLDVSGVCAPCAGAASLAALLSGAANLRRVVLSAAHVHPAARQRLAAAAAARPGLTLSLL